MRVRGSSGELGNAEGLAIGPTPLNTTGQVLNAFSVDNPALKRISPLSLLISPFALLEIFAYAIGMSRSGMLVYYLIRERKTLKQSWKKIIIPTIIEIGIVIVILFIGSVVEWQVLAQRTELSQIAEISFFFAVWLKFVFSHLFLC